MVVDGREFDLIGFSTSFAINEIPTSTCYLPVGRTVKGGRQRAKIHSAYAELLYMKKAKIFVELEGEQLPGRPWPKGRKLVFEGYVSGLGFQRSRKSFNVAVKLVHWLVQLVWSSSLSEALHPGTPTDVAFKSTLLSQPLGGAAGQDSSLVLDIESVMPGSLLTVGNDVWEAIKKLLLAIAEKPILNPSTLGFVSVGSQTNTAAIEALQRIDYFGGPILRIKDGSASISVALAKFIGGEAVQSFGEQTFWGKLVGTYSPYLMLIFSPRVTDCLVRPFAYSHRTPYKLGIRGEDYVLQDFDSVSDRPIRGIALYGAEDPTASGVMSGPGEDLGRYMNSYYVPEDCEECRHGSVMFFETPQWLHNALEITAAQIDPTLKPRNGILGAATDVPPVHIEHPDVEPIRNLAEHLSRCIYARESLRHRLSQVAGRLRFDICPGSTVEIEGVPERQTKAFLDQLSGNAVATVTRVTVAINAQAKQGGTSYELGWLRTEAENKSDRFSVVRHPIYDVEWSGDPLIPELA
jgi:hypothetical protein